MRSEIYQPAEDSYLFKETLTDYLKNIKDKNIIILDMGSGSGILAQTCSESGFDDILAADINEEAVELLRKKGFKSISSNLFSKLKEKKFNLIIFNPPYLQENKLEPKDSKIATTGGKQGYEIIIQFLKQAKSHLKRKGIVLLLFSSLSKPRIIKKQAKQLKYKVKLLNKQKLFFEELGVYEISYNI